MRRIAFPLLALISLTYLAAAATRPHYGGTLRAAVQSAPMTLEFPAETNPTDYRAMSRILLLVGDSLVTIDAEDRPHPALANAWAHDATMRHWELTLRHGVKFHDGTSASPTVIAQMLAALHPDWKVYPSSVSAGVRISPDGSIGDSITIETEPPNPSLLTELALPRNLILSRTTSGIPIGTGPFRVTDFQPSKHLKLAAVEDCWSGRPFLDAIEIELGESPRDQAVALELGRVDLIEAAPRTVNSSARFHTSLPVELLALVFPPNSKAQDAHLREVLALSIDRKPIQSVLLKGAGEPTATLLPNWMTGYGAAFSTQSNIKRAKTLLAESQQSPLTLSYDPRDPQSQLIAERIALNARDAGITVQVSLSGAADLRLVRLALPSPDPALALREMARQLSLPQPMLRGNTVDDLYPAERGLLDRGAVIPLFHLPVASAVGSSVRGWAPDLLGEWKLADVWLADSRAMDSRPGDSR